MQRYVIYAFVASTLCLLISMAGANHSAFCIFCLRLGFLETDSELQNQGRKLIGNSSQEIQLQR